MAEYINNKDFFNAYCEWKTEYRGAIMNGTPTPVMTEYMGKCVLLICNNLSFRYNFIAYPFKEELVEDGIEACVKAMPKFDEINYSNIFAYFTQCAFTAFVRRIKIEKREYNLKLELIKENVYQGIVTQEFDNEEYQVQMRELIVSTIDANSLGDAIDDKLRNLNITPDIDDDDEKSSTEMDIYGDEE